MEKVMLAMSGGVDSSVALLLLKDKYELCGVTLDLFCSSDSTKASGKDVKDAAIVASKYNIPHEICNYQEEFKASVVMPFINSYLEAATPNPCVQCNKHIKFGKLYQKALADGFDYIATGHYARIRRNQLTGRYELLKAINDDGTTNDKDQSYVLYNLSQEQLSHTLFPLGDIPKFEVRKLAEQNMLISAKKSDSQDICFIPDGDYPSFIKSYTGFVPIAGNFLFTNGDVLGRHNGLINYTIGQRRGLHIAFGTPVYVVSKDALTNTVTVGEDAALYSNTLIANQLNFISIPAITAPLHVKARIRYHQKESECVVTPLDESSVKVTFKEPQRAIAKGQSVVFYDADVVVGGGIIC